MKEFVSSLIRDKNPIKEYYAEQKEMVVWHAYRQATKVTVRTTCHLLLRQQISNSLSKVTRDYSRSLDKCTCFKLALQVYLTYSNDYIYKNENIFATSARDANEITSSSQVTIGHHYKYILVLFSKGELTYKHKKEKVLRLSSISNHHY